MKKKKTVFFLLLLTNLIKCIASSKKDNILIRPASHSGSWYQNYPNLLSQEIGQYLSNTKKLKEGFVKSIIVPHAGYHFCGQTMAQSFINIVPDNYNRIVILGPSHHEYFQGCGLTSFDKFDTPLGPLNIDVKYIKKLLKKSDLFFEVEKSVDIKEHSIEMELPFLKYIFKDKELSIIPIIVGDNDFYTNNKIAEALYELYEDKSTLFVISSDFCHWGRNFGFMSYDKKFENIWESIEDLDKQALNIIKEINSEKLDKYFKRTKNTICGRNPIIISLSIVEKFKKNHKSKIVEYNIAGYAQSNKVKSMYETSVSYAAVVNYI